MKRGSRPKNKEPTPAALGELLMFRRRQPALIASLATAAAVGLVVPAAGVVAPVVAAAPVVAEAADPLQMASAEARKGKGGFLRWYPAGK